MSSAIGTNITKIYVATIIQISFKSNTLNIIEMYYRLQYIVYNIIIITSINPNTLLCLSPSLHLSLPSLPLLLVPPFLLWVGGSCDLSSKNINHLVLNNRGCLGGVPRGCSAMFTKDSVACIHSEIQKCLEIAMVLSVCGNSLYVCGIVTVTT